MKATKQIDAIVIRNCGFGQEYETVTGINPVYEKDYEPSYEYGGNSGDAWLEMNNAEKFIFCKD